MRKWSSSFYTVFLLSAIVVAFTFSGQHVLEKQSRIITWDVYGYYLYLPAVFIYHDTKEYQFAPEQIKQYNVCSNLYQLNPVGDKVMAPAYTMGLAMLWTPFFAAAHLYASITHHYPADGLSFPYQMAVILAAIFYAVIGIWFLRQALLFFFSDPVTTLTLICIVLGTNYFHYICFECGMPHTFIFSLHAILFYLVVRWYRQPSTCLSAGIGIVLALASLARPTEALAVIFFLLYDINHTGLKGKALFFRQHFLQLTIIAVVGFVTIMPQILYWHFNIGHWFYNGHGDHKFTFLKPHLYEGLLGYRKGLLIYTPIMLLAMIGFLTRRIRTAGLLLAVLVYFSINTYVIYSWDVWWYASSFGARALIQSYALLSIPLASFLSFAAALRMPLRVIIYAFITFCIGLNQFQDWQYRHRIIPLDETNKLYYWKVFGKISVPDRTLRRYLDIEQELPADQTFSTHVLSRSGDSAQINTLLTDGFSPTVSVLVNEGNIKSLSQAWVREQLDMMANTDNFGEWHEGRLVFEVDRKGQSIQWQGLRIQDLIETKKWTHIHAELRLPVLQPGDELKVYVWNQGPDTIYYKYIELDEMRKVQSNK
jgi:hypothetical protein